MKTVLAILVLPLLVLSGPAAPAAAQTAPSRPGANPVTGAPIPGPMQALGNIIRNPDAPPPSPPPLVTSRPLGLPTAIPPATGSSGR